jgi:pimeloyl-ACP methyl ester carboxylesterase
VDGPSKERVIVFVHGIFGDSTSTWKRSASTPYWPRLLLADHAFDDVDVYVANFQSPHFGNTMTVDEIVAQLNSRLTADGVYNKHREVVFVCHSLGGIVVQRLLLTFRDHAKQVPFIYFFAVPEEGSQIAKIGRLFNADPLLDALFSGNENGYLLNLENEWRAAKFNIRRYCAYEKRASAMGFLIVDRLSATRNCDETPIPINADHKSIVKPLSMLDDSYYALRNAEVENPIAHTPPRSNAPRAAENGQFKPRIEIGLALGAEYGGDNECGVGRLRCLSESQIRDRSFDLGANPWHRIIYRVRNLGSVPLKHPHIHIEAPSIGVQIFRSDQSRIERAAPYLLELWGPEFEDLQRFLITKAYSAFPIDVVTVSSVTQFDVLFKIFGDNMEAHSVSSHFTLSH